MMTKTSKLLVVGMTLAIASSSLLNPSSLAQSPATSANAQTGASAPLAPIGAQPRGARRKFTSKTVLIPGLHLSKEIPVNFPVPTYPTNVSKKDFVNSTQGSPTAGMSLVTADDIATVFNWYFSYFTREKWAVKTPSAAAMEKLHPKTKLYFLEATREKNQVNLVCTPNPTGGTLITVNWSAIQK
jgi:hypothetical protein